MRAIGRAFGRGVVTLCLLVLVAGGTAGRAEVSAGVDRERVALGDTLRLTITATGENEDVSGVDLSPLQEDFEVLQRSTQSSTSIVNGQHSQERKLLLDLTPLREGELEIPSLQVGQRTTAPLRLTVDPAPAAVTGDSPVLFEMEADRDSVYVQGQLILTLRLQTAINLEGHRISEPEPGDAFVKPLEQKSYRRTIDGRPWLVHELRYAIFPEQSGTLEIPAVTFSARESQPRRSLFDMGGNGRLLRRTAGPLRVEVLPRPDEFPAATWLPASGLTLEESWSRDPQGIRAGESVTRTITVRGEGLQGAQLPPVLFPSTEGLKQYPDQPVIGETETGAGLLGSRRDSAALVPTRPGSLSIPEIRIPWWDTRTGELRHAVLPPREIAVAPGDPAVASPALPAPSPQRAAAGGTPVHGRGSALPWQLLSALSSAGWLLTLAWLFRSRRGGTGGEQATAENPSERAALRQLRAACTGGDPLHARRALLCWASARSPGRPLASLAQVSSLFNDPALSAELRKLDAALYGPAASAWEGAALAATARRLSTGRPRTRAGNEAQSLRLYPQSA
jgi:hypothetical protein